MTHDLLISAHESRVRSFVNLSMALFSLAKEKKVVARIKVRHPTSLIDLDMENYRDSVTLLKY